MRPAMRSRPSAWANAGKLAERIERSAGLFDKQTGKPLSGRVVSCLGAELVRRVLRIVSPGSALSVLVRPGRWIQEVGKVAIVGRFSGFLNALRERDLLIAGFRLKRKFVSWCFPYMVLLCRLLMARRPRARFRFGE